MDRSLRYARAAAETAGLADETLRRRFVEYFPRVFAYAYSWTMDEEKSREVVIEAFARSLSRRAAKNEDDFAVVLFSATRDLCSGVRSISGQTNPWLSDPEREVLALLFDAQLTRQQVGSLLTVPEESVVTMLVNGLRKLTNVTATGPETPLQQT